MHIPSLVLLSIIPALARAAAYNPFPLPPDPDANSLIARNINAPRAATIQNIPSRQRRSEGHSRRKVDYQGGGRLRKRTVRRRGVCKTSTTALVTASSTTAATSSITVSVTTSATSAMATGVATSVIGNDGVVMPPSASSAVSTSTAVSLASTGSYSSAAPLSSSSFTPAPFSSTAGQSSISSSSSSSAIPTQSPSPSPAPSPSASPSPSLSPSPSPSTTSTTSTTSTATSTTSSATASYTPSTPAKRITVDPSGTDGPFSGWGTWYDVGLGSCGWYNQPGDPIVAISAELMADWPGYDGSNPNNFPMCGAHLAITWGGKTVVAEVADTCPGCAIRSLDMSKGLFEQFATLPVGLLGMDSYTGNITWSWVEGSGSLPAFSYTP